MEHKIPNLNELKYLDWDSRFFGFSIGRIHAQASSEMLLKKELEKAAKEKIQFVELFCDASDLESIYSTEILAFHLADLRFTLKKNLTGSMLDNNAQKEYIIKKAGPGDINDLKIAGHGLFTSSRYYRYPGFDRDKIDLMFQLWIEKAVTGEFDDELYYLGNETGILAFNSLKYKENTASIGLFGVTEAHRGKGLGSVLLNRVFHLFQARSITAVNELTVVTQGRNSSAVNLYQKNGFSLAQITLCYYKWLEPGAM